MKSNSLNNYGTDGKGELARGVKAQAELDRAIFCIDIECSGDWMPAEELRDAALVALEAAGDVTVNLANLDHLDASALQILLALDAEQKRRGRNLELVNASTHLVQWFHYAGAMDRFALTGPNSNE